MSLPNRRKPVESRDPESVVAATTRRGGGIQGSREAKGVVAAAAIDLGGIGISREIDGVVAGARSTTFSEPPL